MSAIFYGMSVETWSSDTAFKAKYELNELMRSIKSTDDYRSHEVTISVLFSFIGATDPEFKKDPLVIEARKLDENWNKKSIEEARKKHAS